MSELSQREQTRHYEDKLRFEIDSWDLSQALQEEKPILVIDTRSVDSYGGEHIPGAIHLPHGQMNDESTSSLSKEALLVTYCDGIGCNASTKGALHLTRLGFQVKELIGGLDWWKRDGHPTHRDSKECEPKTAGNCGCGEAITG